MEKMTNADFPQEDSSVAFLLLTSLNNKSETKCSTNVSMTATFCSVTKSVVT